MLREIAGQLNADEEKHGKLSQHDEAAGEQRRARRLLRLRAEIALNHRMVGAVRSESEHRATDEAGPKGVWLGPRPTQIENLQLAGICREMHNFSKSTVYLTGDDEN